LPSSVGDVVRSVTDIAGPAKTAVKNNPVNRLAAARISGPPLRRAR
jgi:hypothetical protein